MEQTLYIFHEIVYMLSRLIEALGLIGALHCAVPCGRHKYGQKQHRHSIQQDQHRLVSLCI